MSRERLKTNILGVRILANAQKELLSHLAVREGDRSIGILTTDCDDVSYTALDEATKKADVCVAYARSMYAGAKNASTALAGEFIGILAGESPEAVRSGLEAAISCIKDDAAFYAANEEGSVVYYAHCISRSGTYLSRKAGIEEGSPMAYLIAPPLEATVGLDAALKAASVELKIYYGPPTETNFAGGLLTGEQSACEAACNAFAETVCKIAENPLLY